MFRPYEDPIKIRPYPPQDRGYFFYQHNNNIKIVQYTLEDNGFRDIKTHKQGETYKINDGSWTIFWSIGPAKKLVYEGLHKYQKVNHFPCSFYMTRKDLMYRQISKLREIHGAKHFSFIPKTYILPNEIVFLEDDMKRNPKKQWIVKPAASSQGRGIFVTTNLAEIPHKDKNMVVSEYIGSPLLLNGYKFDLRIYVAVTSVNPLRIYIYEEGLARFATCKYTESTTGSSKATKFMHLTNYSVNKKNINFIETNGEEDGTGSKWSLGALRTALRAQGIDDSVVWRKIEDICIKTVISAEPFIFQAMNAYVPHRDNCFELLGFDILIDSALEPWLIEVNLSCSLGCDSALDQRVKAALVADLFTLIGVAPLDKRK